MVISHYNRYMSQFTVSTIIRCRSFFRDETVSAIMSSIFIPNIIFVVSVAILVYWYCPYCESQYRNLNDQDNDR